MVIDYKRYELYGKPVLQKLVLKPPFSFSFPVADYACFLYLLEGGIRYHQEEEQLEIPARHSLLLHCIHSTKQISTADNGADNQVVVINFHPDVLKKIYERELPFIFQPPQNRVSNQSMAQINIDFLIHKYIEGLLFYFENPSLVNDDILILKLKEILILLSQTLNAGAIQVILSQLFSPATYSFREIIEANLYSQLTVEGMAAQTNLSVSSFKREFAKLYNDSPSNYIRSRRLQKAADLLMISNNRISDIAFDCGYSDLANFTKSFHDKYGTTPTQYRLKKDK